MRRVSHLASHLLSQGPARGCHSAYEARYEETSLELPLESVASECLDDLNPLRFADGVCALTTSSDPPLPPSPQCVAAAVAPCCSQGSRLSCGHQVPPRRLPKQRELRKRRVSTRVQHRGGEGSQKRGTRWQRTHSKSENRFEKLTVAWMWCRW